MAEDASKPRDQTHGREHQNFGVCSPGMARVSGVQNRDERCRTMKGRVGGVLEELENKQQKRPFEKSCRETMVPRSGEPKQLDQTEVLVKHAKFH